MKHFVYLDTDLINSYLAQINDGLVDSIDMEKQTSRTDASSQEEVPSSDGSKFSVGLQGLFAYEHTSQEEYFKGISTISQTEAGREILSKIIHDNSYDKLVKYLDQENNIKDYSHNKSPTVGDYLTLNGDFKMVDLSVITSLFDDNFKKVYSSIISGNLEDFLENMNRQQRRSNEFKKEENAIRNKLDSDLQMIDTVIEMIVFISKLLPSDKYVIYEDIFIPLDKKYLREDYNSIRYKYTSKSTIVGNVTGNLKSIMDFKPNNDLDEVIKSVDDLLFATLDILSIGESFKVMHPIAWYF